MVDIPLAPPTPSPSAAAALSPAGGTTPVSVSITTLPSSVVELLEAVQTSATPVVVSESTLVLNSELGNFTVSLAQQLGMAEKQHLAQQLISFVQAQKPLMLTLQPGSPPTQGVLLIPSAVAAAQTAAPTSTAGKVTQAKPLTTGTQLRAIVLPSDPSTISAEPLGDAGATVAAPLGGKAAPAGLPLAGNEGTAERVEGAVSEINSCSPPVEKAQGEVLAPLPQGVRLQTGEAAPQLASSYPELIIARQAPELGKRTLIPPSPEAQANTLSPSPRLGAPSPQSLLMLQGAPEPQSILKTAPQTGAASTVPVEALQVKEVPLPVPPRGMDSAGEATPPSSAPVQPPAKETTQSVAAPQLQAWGVVEKNPAPVRQQTAAQLLAPGNEVSLRVDEVLPRVAEGAEKIQALPALQANQVLATVAGSGTDGQLILKAGDATLFVKSDVTAPMGSSVIVTVEEIKDNGLVTAPLLQNLNFQALPQALAALEQINPQLFHSVVSNFLPQPTESLTGALLFLLGAFKKGNVGGWLGGDAVETLKNAGKSSIVGNLSKELSAAGQRAQDPVVGEWQSYPIPLYAYNQFQSITLHVHSDRDARKDIEGRAVGPGKIRFLIDMRLSKLGSMQIDGFVQQKKLDMVLRSENVLPEGLHEELRLAYIKALEAVGYAGALNFQVGRQHWMTITKDSPTGIVT